MMGMGCITDIAAMNEDKNISLEYLKQTLGKIMATRVQGEWLVAPVKWSVAKLLDKFDFNPSPELIEELLAEEYAALTTAYFFSKNGLKNLWT